MSVVKVSKKERNFFLLNKTCLYENKLSWAAKGLHSYLMSFRDNLEIELEDLLNSSNTSEDIFVIFQELKQHGYLSIQRFYDEVFEAHPQLRYTISEFPIHGYKKTPFIKKFNLGARVKEKFGFEL